MIGFFPIIYDDELIYSHLSRYYAKSGYLVYRSVAEDLFVYSTNKPSIEFCNSLTSDLLDNITQIMPLQEYIYSIITQIASGDLINCLSNFEIFTLLWFVSCKNIFCFEEGVYYNMTKNKTVGNLLKKLSSCQ